MSIANVLPSKPVPSEHVDVLLELAYAMTAVDGRLGDDEIAAFRTVIGRLRGQEKVSNKDVDALLERFAGNIEKTELEDRVREIAPKLPADLKDLAYKVALALSLVDLDASRDESDLNEVLAESLGLDDDKVQSLTDDVYAAFDRGSD